MAERAKNAVVLRHVVRGGDGLSAGQLAPYLAPQRAGDPLGLGIAPGDRPPAPADPDPYDREAEDASYARSLLSEEERASIDAGGLLTIEQVRDIVLGNTTRGSIEAAGLDPEMMAMIDARINFKIFIAGDNIYTREELYENFPFHELNVQPEVVFDAQEIGIFEPGRYALDGALEYEARGVDDATVDFVKIEDLVGMAARKNYTAKRAPIRIVKTKVYLGKERWDDFALLQRFFRGAARVASAQLAYNGGSSYNPMMAMLSGPAGPRAKAIGVDQEVAAAAMAEREAAMRAREEEQHRREERQRAREEEQRRREDEISKKISADLARVEEMLAAVGLRNQATSAPPVPSAAAADAEDDSVPL